MGRKKFIEGEGLLTVANKDGDTDNEKLTPKERVANFLEAYEKQNPKKFAKKMENGELSEDKLKGLLS